MKPILRFLTCSLLIFITGCSKQVEQSQAEDALTLEQSLQIYQALVAEAEQALQDSDFYESLVARAEAYRYLSGIAAVQLRDKLHFGIDTAYPTLHRVVAIGNKWGFSNPDNLYLAATIDDRHAYRISGRLGSANHTIIGTYSGDDEDGVAGERILGRDIVTDPEGRFELVVSREKPDSTNNWIQLVEDATSLTIYQVFGDWEHERKGEFRIEAIGQEGKPQPALTPDQVAQALVAAGETARDRVLDWLSIANKIDLLPNNTFMPPRQIQIASYGSWFEYGNYALDPDEAVILEVAVPSGARYWGMTLYNWWGETLDYRNRQTTLNHNQAIADSDGKLRFVLAASDPGAHNWLDVSGHLRGPINWRVNATEEPGRIKARRVALADLWDHLPAGTPRVSLEERRQMLMKRQRQVDRRYAE